MKYRLRRGKTYEAQLVLRGLVRRASNYRVQAALTEFGFSDVQVTGVGANRIASGTWSKRSILIELPKEVVEIKEI